MNIMCRDCTFYSLSSEGLDTDWCRFFHKSLTRDEVTVGIDCQEFIERREEGDAAQLPPELIRDNEQYEVEIKRYIRYMVFLLAVGIIFFYLFVYLT